MKLKLEVPVERRIEGGSSHLFRINLENGCYLKVGVIQRGVDLDQHGYAVTLASLGFVYHKMSRGHDWLESISKSLPPPHAGVGKPGIITEAV